MLGVNQGGFMSIIDWFAQKKSRQIVEREKLDIPGDLWVKCLSCGEVLYHNELQKNHKVCPKCDHHFRLTYQERLTITVDADSFKEFDSKLSSVDFLKFVDLKSYHERIELSNKRSTTREAVVTGEAKINGIPVIIGVMDFSYMGGSMGSVVGEKITRACEHAIAKKMSLILMASSGGARMQEGVISLMQMAKTSAALKKLSDAHLLYISVLLDPTTGGTTASFAMLGDVNISEPNALIGFAGPRVIEQTIRQKLPKGFQRSEYLLEHGMLDLVCHRRDMKQILTQMLQFATV